MKICLIIPSFYPATVYGGPIYSVYPVCSEIAKMGITINVATTNASGKVKLNVDTQKTVLLSENLSVHYYNETIIGRFSFPFIWGVKNEIKVSEAIHIQAVYSIPTPVSFFIAKVYRKPIIFSPRGALSQWALAQRKYFKKIWLTIFIRPFVKNIHWHATAEKEKQEILKLFPKAKVSVIPNGIYLNQYKFQKISKEEFVFKFSGRKVEQVNRIIVSMGRIHKVKAFDVLIKSFSLILTEFPDSYLFIAGKDDGEFKNLENLIESENIKSKIFFTGELEGRDKATFLGNADVFVLPSHTENFGNVYIESLACGTPIVASTNTPWQEVEAAGCGRWVPNTVNETALAIIDLLSRDREILRTKSLKFAEKYEWKNIAKQFVVVYSNSVKK